MAAAKRSCYFLINGKGRHLAGVRREKTNIRAACYVLIFILLLGASVSGRHVILDNRYNKALELMSSRRYEDALPLFASLAGYKDSASRIETINTALVEEQRLEAEAQIESENAAAYERAEQMLIEGKYDDAALAFLRLGSYRDSVERREEALKSKIDEEYIRACKMAEADNIEDAVKAVTALDAMNGYKDSAKLRAQVEARFPILCAAVGDTVYFGRYEQDNDEADGKEKIEWIVLARENNWVLLVSACALDCLQYEESRKETTWETSALRAWLNGSFLETAFSTSEGNVMPLVTVSADENPQFDTYPGNNTQDRVFLLSCSETEQYMRDEWMICPSTAYAQARGCYDYRLHSACNWWLRTPGGDPCTAAFIHTEGSTDYFGNDVDFKIFGVRPAIWVDLTV